MYNKINQSELVINGCIQWNPTLAEHISGQVELCYDDSDAERIAELPTSIRNLFYLWGFECEAGGGGIEVFILQQSAHEIRGAYEALSNIGANRLKSALSSAVAMTISASEDDESYAEYRESESDLSWFKQFSDKNSYEDLASIDEAFETFELIESELKQKVDDYIKSNFDEIAFSHNSDEI